MIRCVLFDLDGTLVHCEFDDFLKEYLKVIPGRAGAWVEPAEFTQALLAATDMMIKDQDPSRSNKEVFMDEFFRRVSVKEDILMPVFEQFYRNEFKELKDVLGVRPHPSARRMIEFLFEEGYEVVIATNAIFPREAIEERMRWGGIDRLPYKLVTCYETMHFCKPNLEYYRETLEIIQYEPRECLMVGNNVDEDIVASALGLKTYLVDDFLLDSGANQYFPDFRSDFSGLADFVLSGSIRML